MQLSTKKTNIKAPHFVHYVMDEVGSLGIKTGEGINVYTTLDYPVFQLSQDIARNWVDTLKTKHDLTNASLILLKNDTGEILNMLGGVDYFDSKNSGQVNLATALRQPGSALKPVTYAAAFMKGYTPASIIYDVPKVYKTKKGAGFTPNNYDGRFHGLVLPRVALASSYNLPAVEMLNRVGIQNFLKVSKDMGINTFTQEGRYDLSLTLGGGEVKLVELANVFATFARGGVKKEFYAIEMITSDNGRVLYRHKADLGKQALGERGEEVSYLITDILSDPKARIPGFSEKSPLVLSRPAAVKTGTTTDWHDNWTVGYTPSYTVGVWVGNNDNHPMRNISGVVGAAPIWNQFLEEFLKGKPVEKFTPPEGITSVEICSLSGKLFDGLCPERTRELFLTGSEPREKSRLHKEVKIDVRNGLLAGGSCEGAHIQSRVFVDYPPEVHTWAVKENLETMPRQTSPLCGSGNDLRSGGSYLQIVYPKEKAVFETAPFLVRDEAVVFEANVSEDVTRVKWYVDGKLFKESSAFPFNASWSPAVGKHAVKAVGVTRENLMIKSGEVKFSVVEFKDENID